MTNQGVGTFLPCIYCGYDLRGLTASAVCPECGTPLQASADLSIPGPVSSITRVRHGLLAAVITLCAMFIYAGLSYGFRGSVTARLQIAFALVTLLSGSLRVLSSWWMTRPCERSAPCGRWRMRLAVRMLAFTSVGFELLVGTFYYSGGVASGVGLAVYLTSLAIHAFWVVSVGLYLGFSTTDMGLAVRIRRAAGLAGLAFLLTAVLLLYDAICPSGSPMPPWRVVVQGVLGLGGLLSVLWLTMVLLEMRSWYSRILARIEQLRCQAG